MIGTQEQEGIIPLHVENTWKYEIYLQDSISTLVNTDTEDREIFSDTLIFGER